MRRNGGLIATNTEFKDATRGSGVSSDDPKSSGMYDLFDQYNHKANSNDWPYAPAYVSLIPSVTTVAEGVGMTITLTTEGIPDGTQITYEVITTSGTTMVNADFSGITSPYGISSSPHLSNGTYTWAIVCTADGLSEAPQKFTLNVWVGSNSNIVVTSPEITVTDSAVPLGEDLTSWWPISTHYVNSQTYMGNTADYNGPYHCAGVRVSNAGLYRFLLSFKVTTLTTYFNDVPIAAIVHQASDGTTNKNVWIFHSTSGGSGSTWNTTTTSISGNSANGRSQTPSQAANSVYASLAVGNNNQRFQLLSYTGSSYTGALDGISAGTTSFPISTSTAPAGVGNINQASGTYFVYAETSGAVRYSQRVLRGPQVTIVAGDYLKVVYAITVPTNMINSLNVADTLSVGVA